MVPAISSPQTLSIRVVIADDHELFVDGFKFAMSKFKEVQIIGDANNGLELIKLVEEKRPDIVFVDISMPKMDGIAATKVIKQKLPFIYVIALSAFDESSFIADMFEAGASGYLLKSADKNEILRAIQKVGLGEVYCTHNISNKMVGLMKRTNYNPLKPFDKVALTTKETSVMKLTAEGYSSKEVADMLNVDTRSIESTKERIIHKTGCRSSGGMGLWAVRNNIIKP